MSIGNGERSPLTSIPDSTSQDKQQRAMLPPPPPSPFFSSLENWKRVDHIMWLLFGSWVLICATHSVGAGKDGNQNQPEQSFFNSSSTSSITVALFLLTLSIKCVATLSQKAGVAPDNPQQRLWRGGERGFSNCGMVMVCALLPSLLFVVQRHVVQIITSVQSSQGRDDTQDTTIYYYQLIVSATLASFSSLWTVLDRARSTRSTNWTSEVGRLTVMPLVAFLLWRDWTVTLLVTCHDLVFYVLFRSLERIPNMHHVWTMGEYALVTFLLTCLVVYHVICHVHAWGLDSHQNVYGVARAGFLGAIWVCPVAHYVVPSPAPITTTTSNRVWLRLGLSVPLILGLVELELSWRRVDRLYFPRSLTWLGQFLGEEEKSCLLGPSTLSLLSWPRYYWLLYWLVVLVVTLQWLPSVYQTWASHLTGKYKDGETVVTRLSPGSMVTLRRKWFHLVALLIFGPACVFAPQMMALSFAVALSILMVVEGLHVRQNVSEINAYFQAFLDPRKNEMTAIENQDSKFIVSHMALIAGCAMPLYLALFLLETEKAQASVTLYRSLSLVGIVGLGVGDAAAAVTGTIYSQWIAQQGSKRFRKLEEKLGLSRWGRLRRTWVGSLSMMLSMYTAVSAFATEEENNSPILIRWWLCLLWMTVIEAYTSQLDNVIIPLVGATAFLCWQS